MGSAGDLVTDILGTVDAVIAALEAGGVRATIDGRDLNPPAVLVRPPVLTYRYGKGYADAEFSVWAVVPDTGMRASFQALGALLDEIQQSIGFIATTARPDSVTLVDGSTVNGYVLTWTQRVPA